MAIEETDSSAGETWPITVERVAERLHWKSLRTLKERCRKLGCFGMSGRTMILFERHYEELCRSIEAPARPSHDAVPRPSMSAASAYSKALARATAGMQKRKLSPRSAKYEGRHPTRRPLPPES